VYGDYNRNGTVDQADYSVWRHQMGQSVTPFSGADGNGDGIVNQADYDIWRSHFGQSIPVPAAGALLAGSDGSSGSTGGVAASLDSGVGDDLSSTTVAPAFAGLVLDGGTSTAFATSMASMRPLSTATTSSSSSDLLLMDAAIGDVDTSPYHTTDDSLCDSVDQQDAHPNDLALAAVLNDDSSWWDEI